MEELEKAEKQIEGKGTSHDRKECVWKGRISKSGKREWERRVCIRIESEHGSCG